MNNCRISAARAADLLFHSCTNNGVWDAADRRCELDGQPFGTQEVQVAHLRGRLHRRRPAAERHRRRGRHRHRRCWPTTRPS